MARSLADAQQQVSVVARKILAITDDKSLSDATQAERVAPLHTQLLAAQEELKSWEQVAARRTAMFGGSDPASAYGGPATSSYGPGGVGSAALFAPLALDDDQLRQLHDAAVSKKSVRVSVGRKDVVDGSADVPATLGPTLPSRFEPVRIAELFSSTAMPGPVVQYVRVNGTANPAAAVAAGGLKPDLGLDTDTLECRARKLAALIRTNDESLADFPGWAQVLTAELRAAVVKVENTQLLSGNGTDPNLAGLLGTSRLLGHARTTESPLDALEISVEALRTGPSFAEADAVVMHPSDWSA